MTGAYVLSNLAQFDSLNSQYEAKQNLPHPKKLAGQFVKNSLAADSRIVLTFGTWVQYGSAKAAKYIKIPLLDKSKMADGAQISAWIIILSMQKTSQFKTQCNGYTSRA